jgi:hypothetical protein
MLSEVLHIARPVRETATRLERGAAMARPDIVSPADVLDQD